MDGLTCVRVIMYVPVPLTICVFLSLSACIRSCVNLISM